MPLTRREMLLASGAALIGPAAATRLFAGPTKAAPKKILFFTKSQTFQHSPIERKDGKLGMAEEILVDLGKKANLEVVPSKDGTMFDPDKIAQWDAFVFMTTGNLTERSPHKGEGPPMSKDGKKAFLDAIRAGKGFLGMHCATDTFHSTSDKELDPYIEMIGGEFISHGDQQKVKLDVTDPNFPGVGGFGTSSFEITDEWYALKNFQDDLHVILAHDTATFGKKTGGNKVYDRPNFPETWARMHGKGRVFYTSMGHREDVWENPKYQGLLVGALRWATGEVDADIKPNASVVSPYYKTLHKA